MTDLMIVVIIIVIVGFAAFSLIKKAKEKTSCCSSGTYKAKEKKLNSVALKKVAVVEGMTCQHCVNRVMEAVNSIDGASGNVNLRKGTVVISMEQPMDDEIFRKAIERAGYTVKEMR